MRLSYFALFYIESDSWCHRSVIKTESVELFRFRSLGNTKTIGLGTSQTSLVIDLRKQLKWNIIPRHFVTLHQKQLYKGNIAFIFAWQFHQIICCLYVLAISMWSTIILLRHICFRYIFPRTRTDIVRAIFWAQYDHVLSYLNCDGNDIWSSHVGYVNIILNWNASSVDFAYWLRWTLYEKWYGTLKLPLIFIRSIYRLK